MSNIKVCDGCGKEILESNSELSIITDANLIFNGRFPENGYFKFSKTYDLCAACAIKVKEFIDNEKARHQS